MWLYIGPEVIAPVLSALAAVGGVLMLFWQRVVTALRSLAGRPRPADEDIGEEDVVG